jgi:hypothetical protein
VPTLHSLVPLHSQVMLISKRYQASQLGDVRLSAMLGCSFIALVALSRKKALIVEPISHTWRNNSSYSSGRNFTVTRTVQADLRSVLVTLLLRFFGGGSIHRAPNATVRELPHCAARRRPQNPVSPPPINPTMLQLPAENEDQSCLLFFLLVAFLGSRLSRSPGFQ